MWPVLLKLGDFHLATYGLVVASAYLLGILWMKSRIRDMDLTENEFWGLVYSMFAGAVLGSKALYVSLNWEHFAAGRLEFFRDFRFGFVFYGGFIGGVLGVWLWCRWRRKGFLRLADYFGTALALGHSLGRLACLMAGCCYGRPTDMPWGLRFTDPDGLVPDELLGTPLHPVQLYEAAGELAIFWFLSGLLSRVKSKELKKGAVFSLYVLLYSALRFSVEFLRGDPRGGSFNGLSPSQWIALATGAMAALAFLKNGLWAKR